MIDIEAELEAVRALYDEMDVALASPDDHLFVPNTQISDWSIGQQLHHIGSVNRTVAMSLIKLVQDATDRDADRRATLTGVSVLASGYIPRGRGKAPARLRPSNDLSRGDVVNSINKSRAKVEELNVFGALLKTRMGRIEHPFLGYLKPSQWVRFINVHTEHHLKIVREIERSKA